MRSPTTRLGLGLAATLMLGASSGGMEQWQRFEPPEQPFSVLMPGSMSRSQRVSHTIVGSVKTQLWSADAERAQYSVSVTNLPTVAAWFVSDEGLYEKARAQMMKELDAEVVAIRRVDRGPFEQEIEYRVPTDDGDGPRTGRALMSADGDEVVVVNGIAQPKAPVSLEDFFLGVAVQASRR